MSCGTDCRSVRSSRSCAPPLLDVTSYNHDLFVVVTFETRAHGDLKLVVGGKHGYVRVRGGQGRTKSEYQVYTSDVQEALDGSPP